MAFNQNSSPWNFSPVLQVTWLRPLMTTHNPRTCSCGRGRFMTIIYHVIWTSSHPTSPPMPPNSTHITSHQSISSLPWSPIFDIPALPTRWRRWWLQWCVHRCCDISECLGHQSQSKTKVLWNPTHSVDGMCYHTLDWLNIMLTTPANKIDCLWLIYVTCLQRCRPLVEQLCVSILKWRILCQRLWPRYQNIMMRHVSSGLIVDCIL